MKQKNNIPGFSKLSREEKIKLLLTEGIISEEMASVLSSHLHTDTALQSMYEGFSENTLSNFYIPFGLAPNFLINGKLYSVPFAIEESSIVAAAAYAAKFWASHGGFHARVVNNIKVGHVYFNWKGDKESIFKLFEKKKENILNYLQKYTSSMETRGGGIHSLQLLDKSTDLANHWQIKLEFRTADAMGANFINTVLEALSRYWNDMVTKLLDAESFEPIMAILSNYTPNSLVEAYVEVPIKDMEKISGEYSGEEFAERFRRAVDIALVDSYRAVTHNKGIFNGMDGVIIATGNDFRAVEACGHAYASSEGTYSSLSKVTIEKDIFRLTLRVPMSLGVIGGLTSNHPMAKTALKILDNPSAEELMMIIASAGLANNFSAIRSLVTGGIQKGHMKMHLSNILHQLGANEIQREKAKHFFNEREVSHAAVKEFLQSNI